MRCRFQSLEARSTLRLALLLVLLLFGEATTLGLNALGFLSLEEARSRALQLLLAYFQQHGGVAALMARYANPQGPAPPRRKTPKPGTKDFDQLCESVDNSKLLWAAANKADDAGLAEEVGAFHPTRGTDPVLSWCRPYILVIDPRVNPKVYQLAVAA